MTREEIQRIADESVLAQVQRATGGGYIAGPGRVYSAPASPLSGSVVSALLSPNATITSPALPSVAAAPLEPLPPTVELDTYGTKKNDSGGERRMAGEDGRLKGRQGPDEWDIIDWSRKKPRQKARSKKRRKK